MVNRDFFIALNQLENEGKIDKELVISSLESAIAQAYKKEYGEGRNISVQLNESQGIIRIIAYKTVVETVEDPEKEISLEDALKIKSTYKVGDRRILGFERILLHALGHFQLGAASVARTCGEHRCKYGYARHRTCQCKNFLFH